jgi:hypothetical protein
MILAVVQIVYLMIQEYAITFPVRKMFFVPTDDIPSYVTYKHSSEPSPKEPSVTVANKRKHK